MRISAVQFHIDYHDEEAAWARVETFMWKASQDLVDLIVFPEYFICGPRQEMKEQDALGRFCKLAVKYQIDLVPGTIVEEDKTDGYKYNTTYYIDHSGKVLKRYRKYHLYVIESRRVKSGQDGFRTFKNRFGVEVGLCICMDIAFPESIRDLALNQNAQLIICPAYWIFENLNPKGVNYDHLSRSKMIDALAASRSFENEVVIVVCNSASQSEVERPQLAGTMAGRTQITVPVKGPVVHCDHSREEMITASVDIKKLTEGAEQGFFFKKYYEENRIHVFKNKHLSRL